jgi:hypothetical protein
LKERHPLRKLILISIQIEDIENSTTYTEAIGTISNRKLVLDSVLWNPTAAWTVDGEAGKEQQTPNLASLLNKVLTKANWKSGNAVSFVINGSIRTVFPPGKFNLFSIGGNLCPRKRKQGAN